MPAARPGPQVEVVEVDAANWRQVVAVTPRADQARWVAPVSFYLCLCHYGEVWHPLAVVRGDSVVGHVMWGVDDSDGSRWIGGLVVDASVQSQGIGRAAVRELVARLAQDADCSQVALSYAPENLAARSLYRSLGFVETGETEDDEVVARLDLP